MFPTMPQIPVITLPSDWCHKGNAKLVIRLVGKELRSGVEHYVTDKGSAYTARSLYENWQPLEDQYTAQKAFCKKHGYVWRG